MKVCPCILGYHSGETGLLDKIPYVTWAWPLAVPSLAAFYIRRFYAGEAPASHGAAAGHSLHKR
jgi:hypothetical protein